MKKLTLVLSAFLTVLLSVGYAMYFAWIGVSYWAYFPVQLIFLFILGCIISMMKPVKQEVVTEVELPNTRLEILKEHNARLDALKNNNTK